MRYEVYIWDNDQIKEYDENYGEGSFEEDYDTSSGYMTLSDFGTLVLRTDDRDEANEACGNAFDKIGGRGEAAIWDSEEKEWFN